MPCGAPGSVGDPMKLRPTYRAPDAHRYRAAGGAWDVPVLDSVMRQRPPGTGAVLVDGVRCRPGHPQLLAAFPDGRRVVGLPGERMIVAFCFAAGGAAGLAGMVEVAAVQGAVSSDIATGAGYTGILVAFLARMNPLAIIPFAILLGGLDAAGGLLQQRMNLPDATMLVLRGVLFVMLLASEAFQGRLTRYVLPRRRLAEVV